MNYNFYIGQKVICIDADFPPDYDAVRFTQLPKANEVYIIRDMFEWTWDMVDTDIGLLLEEVHNERLPWIQPHSFIIAEHPFWAARFKPLDEKKTDISVFTKLLAPAPELVD